MKTHVRLVAAAAAGVAFAADQISKFWMIDILGIEDRGPIRLTPFLDIVLAWNPGISYSLLRADSLMGLLGLLALAALAVGVLGAWLWMTSDRPTALALGLVLGGALWIAPATARSPTSCTCTRPCRSGRWPITSSTSPMRPSLPAWRSSCMSPSARGPRARSPDAARQKVFDGLLRQEFAANAEDKLAGRRSPFGRVGRCGAA